ncbi:MAG: aldo/keto reductase [bacterium]
MSHVNRRDFLKTSLLRTSGALLATPLLTHLGNSSPRTSVNNRGIIVRKLGKTGIQLPIVSFGVMRADNPALIPAALKEGFVHFDTAHGYQNGRNEEMLGQVFKQFPRDSFVVSTKVPPEQADRSGVIGPASTAKAFLEKLDISLKRLQLDYVDILYIHGLMHKDAVSNPEMLEALKTAKKLGKAKHVGFSTHRNEPEVVLAAIETGVHEVILTSINFKQAHYPELKKAIAKAAEAGIGIVAMKPMAGGFFDRERKKPINCKAALKFVLQDENVTTSIPGITNFDHLAMNAGVNHELEMTDQEKKDLTEGQSQGGLYCQGCEHCVPNCPKGLPIPDMMRAYMYTYGYSRPDMGHRVLSDLQVSANPCSGCSQCTAVCAKGFNLSDRIEDVARLTTVPSEFFS